MLGFENGDELKKGLGDYDFRTYVAEAFPVRPFKSL